MARDSSYSLYGLTGSTYKVDFTSNPFNTSAYTQLSFVCQHYRAVSGNCGIGFNWGPSAGDVLFRDNNGTLQIYHYDGVTTHGPATASTSLNTWHWKGFRYDASLAAGNRLAAFVDGVKGTDASGPTTFAGWSGAQYGLGYHGSASLPGWGGYIKNAFLWIDKAIPDVAFAAINAGVHPLVFGPTHYYSLENELVDRAGGNNLTALTGGTFSTTQSTPFISLPSGIIVPHRVTGAAPTFQAAWARNANILIGCSQ